MGKIRFQEITTTTHTYTLKVQILASSKEHQVNKGNKPTNQQKHEKQTRPKDGYWVNKRFYHYLGPPQFLTNKIKSKKK